MRWIFLCGEKKIVRRKNQVYNNNKGCEVSYTFSTMVVIALIMKLSNSMNEKKINTGTYITKYDFI